MRQASSPALFTISLWRSWPPDHAATNTSGKRKGVRNCFSTPQQAWEVGGGGVAVLMGLTEPPSTVLPQCSSAVQPRLEGLAFPLPAGSCR